MSGETTRAKCPYCSAEFEVPSILVFTTCPYCGTTFKLGKPLESIEHYVFKLKYDSNQVFEYLKRFVSIQPGVPIDVKYAMSYLKSTLYYVPMYIYEVVVETPCLTSRILDGQEHLEADVLGGQETGFEVIPGVNNYPFPIPRDYSFPAQTREYFKPKIMKEAVYLQPELNPYELLKTIVKPYLNRAISEAELACPGNYEVVNKSSFKGVAHYPFWLVEYEYNGETFKGVVDGADGTIVYLEYPLAKGKRVKYLAVGAEMFIRVC